MTDIVHDSYLSHIGSGFVWSSGAVGAALFDSQTWTPAKADTVLADAISAGAVELFAGYSRQVLASKTAALDSAGHRELLDLAIIDFGSVGTGQDFDTLVIFVQVTDDADSWLICSIDLGAQLTDGTDQTFTPNADGLIALLQP